eukprot:scaffold320441_cov15-Tisochrysis_lutea.AAC.1
MPNKVRSPHKGLAAVCTELLPNAFCCHLMVLGSCTGVTCWHCLGHCPRLHAGIVLGSGARTTHWHCNSKLCEGRMVVWTLSWEAVRGQRVGLAGIGCVRATRWPQGHTLALANIGCHCAWRDHSQHLFAAVIVLIKRGRWGRQQNGPLRPCPLLLQRVRRPVSEVLAEAWREDCDLEEVLGALQELLGPDFTARMPQTRAQQAL